MNQTPTKPWASIVNSPPPPTATTPSRPAVADSCGPPAQVDTEVDVETAEERNGGVAAKRSADRMTVEGSPIPVGPATRDGHGGHKRVDLSETPAAFRQYGVPRDPDSAAGSPFTPGKGPVASSSLHNSPCVPATTGPEGGSGVAPIATSPSIPQLLVISSSGDEALGGHDTGSDHQENSQRTRLLVDGAVGCLKTRQPLAQRCLWVEPQPQQAAAAPRATSSSPLSQVQACMLGLKLSSEPHSPAARSAFAATPRLYAAPLADLLRVHEASYLQHLQRKCSEASSEGQDAAGAPAAHPYNAPRGLLDLDTPLTPSSFDAARKYCGAAMLAVDCVMRGVPCHRGGRGPEETKGDAEASSLLPLSRAFVLGRPPGHHAGSSGCVPSEHFWKRPDMTSSGFCLLNTVAVAAAYARNKYGRGTTGHGYGFGGEHDREGACSNFRIAIVDIDVHHGNGTEDIVRNLTPRETFLPLPSSWAPVSVQTHKPWLDESDARNVFFSSLSLFADSRFYPGSGKELTEAELAAEKEADDRVLREEDAARGMDAGSEAETTEAARDRRRHQRNASNIMNLTMAPLGPGPWDPKMRARLTPAQRLEHCAKASAEMRRKVSARLLPKLRDFQPHLLLISAGFDAHYDDLYHFLTEDDFHWLTAGLCEACNEYGDPARRARDGVVSDHYYDGECRVVSVLEGGYSLASTVAPLTGGAPVDADGAAAAAATVGNLRTRSKAANKDRGVRGDASIAESKSTEFLSAATEAQPPAASSSSYRGALLAGGGEADAAPAPATATAPKARTLKASSKRGAPSAAAAALIDNETASSSGGGNRFLIKYGDGGLVKGVLAHVTALMGSSTAR